jgi:hypothetical protein
MKRVLFLFCLLANVLMVSAQASSSKDDAWKHSKKSLSLGWVNQDFSPEYGKAIDSKFGFMIRKDHTYFLHKKAIGNVVKIGIDAIWSDVTVTKYDTGEHTKDWFNSFDLDLDDYLDDELDDVSDYKKYNIGLWTINYSLGIGPSVTIAPFANSSSGIRFLKVKLYGHFKPTYSILIVSDDNDTDAQSGYCSMFDFGGRISYKIISLGIDGSWGNGKFESLIDSENDIKTKYKFASTRFYLAFNF